MTILVAYVPRPEGRAALEQGIEMAKRLNEDLLVVNTDVGVKSPPPGLFEHAMVNIKEDVNPDDDSVVPDADVARIERELAASGVTARFQRFARGKTTVEEIEALVASKNFSMVVIGLRKRSRVGKLFLGSIAQEILLSVQCPIMAVKAD